MQSLLIAFIIMLSHGVVLAETTKTPSSETTREATPGSSTPNAEKQGDSGCGEHWSQRP